MLSHSGHQINCLAPSSLEGLCLPISPTHHILWYPQGFGPRNSVCPSSCCSFMHNSHSSSLKIECRVFLRIRSAEKPWDPAQRWRGLSEIWNNNSRRNFLQWRIAFVKHTNKMWLSLQAKYPQFSSELWYIDLNWNIIFLTEMETLDGWQSGPALTNPSHFKWFGFVSSLAGRRPPRGMWLRDSFPHLSQSNFLKTKRRFSGLLEMGESAKLKHCSITEGVKKQRSWIQVAALKLITKGDRV